MASISTPLWKSLEKWNATAFLVAGWLLFVATAINGLDLFTPVATQEGILLSVEGIVGFGGVVISFLGLLGLYPRLADATPRLARVGVSLTVLPAAFFSALLVVCSALAPLLGFPSLKTLVPSFQLITATIVVSFAVALTLFGVASLRTDIPSRTVGGLLLVVAAAWFGLVGALQVYQYDIPIWVTFVQTAMMAVPLLTIGYRLWTDTEPADHAELAVEPTV